MPPQQRHSGRPPVATPVRNLYPEPGGQTETRLRRSLLHDDDSPSPQAGSAWRYHERPDRASVHCRETRRAGGFKRFADGFWRAVFGNITHDLPDPAVRRGKRPVLWCYRRANEPGSDQRRHKNSSIVFFVLKPLSLIIIINWSMF
jgi:hypothetical protein